MKELGKLEPEDVDKVLSSLKKIFNIDTYIPSHMADILKGYAITVREAFWNDLDGPGDFDLAMESVFDTLRDLCTELITDNVVVEPDDDDGLESLGDRIIEFYEEAFQEVVLKMANLPANPGEIDFEDEDEDYDQSDDELPDRVEDLEYDASYYTPEYLKNATKYNQQIEEEMK